MFSLCCIALKASTIANRPTFTFHLCCRISACTVVTDQLIIPGGACDGWLHVVRAVPFITKFVILFCWLTQSEKKRKQTRSKRQATSGR